jgi:protein-disulfide isomerase
MIAGIAGVLIAGAIGALLYAGQRKRADQRLAEAQRPGLASDHAPSLGPAGAKVHIVEFLDPACETCAAFYPLVKQMMAENPDRIRLSTRHVPFHRGADEVVRMLEAARAQDKYWQVLEALLNTQARWAPNHTARPELALPIVAGLGLDMQRLEADMRAPAVGQRMALDMRDAERLNVKQTPEYFVNGRQMPSFGRVQLQQLVREALRDAY